MNILKKTLPLIIVILLSFWSVKPLFESGFFPIHDDTQVARVYQMKKVLSEGVFPVRWVPDLGYGYGYPIFNFYAPFAYYVGGFINLAGIDALSATKLMIGLGIILSGISMYFFAREFWGDIGGVVAGLLYVYAPYHAVNIYVRGAVGEFWAYAFLPLAFLGVYKIYSKTQKYLDFEKINKKRSKESEKQAAKFKKSIWEWVSILGLSYAGVILSHNLTAMMVTPFIFGLGFILYVASRISEKVYRPYYILLGLLMGILLSAFYWLPVFPELFYTNVLSVVGGGSDYKDHFACLQQLWNSSWGFGGSAPGCVDGMSFKIGKVHILLSLFSLPVIFYFFRKQKIQLSILIYFTICAGFSVFLMTEYSKLVWDFFPQMAFFQFPWRFLILVCFFASFFGGAAVMYLRSRNQILTYAIGAIIIIGLIMYNSKLFIPQKNINVETKDVISKENLNWNVSKISDEYMPKGFSKPRSPKEVPQTRIRENSSIKVSNLEEKSQSISFKTKSENRENLNINLAYFPAWHVFIDHEQVWFSYFNRGIIIKVPPGTHDIDIRFTQTNIEKIGNALSAGGVIVLLYGIISHRKRIRYG